MAKKKKSETRKAIQKDTRKPDPNRKIYHDKKKGWQFGTRPKKRGN